MNSFELARLKLELDGKAAEDRLRDLATEATKLRKELTDAAKAGNKEGFELLEKQLKKVEKEMGNVRKSTFDVTRVMKDLNGASLNDMLKAQKQISSELDRIKRGTAEWAAKNKQLASVSSEIGKVRREMGQITESEGPLDKIKKFSGWAALAAGAAALVSKVFGVRSEFEKFGAVLTTALGDKSEAQAALKMIQTIAAKTPYSVQQLTDSYVKLVNQGFKPTQKEIISLGDLAASTGKGFDMLTEAIIDAQVGENERLKEFGIRAEKNGNIIKYTFKGITTEVANNSESIRAYITSLGNMQGVAGSMEAISKTMGGSFSNAGDAIDKLLNKLGAGFLGNVIKGSIDWFTKLVNVVADTNTATDKFDEGLKKMVDLQTNIVPMADRYDELAKKTKLSKDEQIEMNKIIEQISTTIPSAVTQVDEYGKAIGISTDRVREYIQAEQARLKVLNKEAITETEAALKKVETNLTIQKNIIDEINRTGSFTKTEVGGAGTYTYTKKVKVTDQDAIAEQQKLYADLLEQRLGYNENLKRLNGDYIKEEAERQKAEAARQKKEAEDRAKKEEQIKAEEQAKKDKKEAAEKAKEQRKRDAEAAKSEKDLAKQNKLQEQATNELYNKKIDILDNYINVEKLNISKQLLNKEITQQQFDDKMLELEITRLSVLKDIQSGFGYSTVQTDQKIVEERLKVYQKSAEEIKKTFEQILQEAKKEPTKPESSGTIADLFNNPVEDTNKADDKDIAELEKSESFKTMTVEQQEEIRNAIREKYHKQALEMYADQVKQATELGAQAGQKLGELLIENQFDIKKTAKEAAKETLLFGLNELQKLANLKIAEITIKQLATVDSIATLGASGLAKAAAMALLVNGVVAVAKGKVSQMYTGNIPVTGATDGKTYNARQIGKVNKTGLVRGGPALINEIGDEFIIDARRSRQIMMNYPHILEAIRNVPQYASGNIGSNSVSTSTAAPDIQQNNILANLAYTVGMLQQQLEKGIQAKYDNNEVNNIRKVSSDFDIIEARASRT